LNKLVNRISNKNQSSNNGTLDRRSAIAAAHLKPQDATTTPQMEQSNAPPTEPANPSDPDV
jgi:hypothetical protein